MVTQEALPLKLEPRCESLWCACDLGAQCLWRNVAPGRDLMYVRARSLGAAPGVDPAQLVFGALQVVLSLVLELEQEFQLGPQAEFLLQAAPDGVVHILAQAWMRAAGVRPVARPQAFSFRALLHEQFARWIEHEHRERAVQRSVAKMRIGLCQEADLAIIAVHQNELLVVP